MATRDPDMIGMKHLRRFSRLGWNAARYALGPIGGVLIPWMVIHRTSKDLWGEVVSIMIVVQLAAHVMQWGSKDLLLREFARRPGQVDNLWQGSITTRVWFALPIFLVFSFLPDTDSLVVGVLWLLILFISNSFDALVIWHKQFRNAFLIDLVGLLFQVAKVRLTLTGRKA